MGNYKSKWRKIFLRKKQLGILWNTYLIFFPSFLIGIKMKHSDELFLKYIYLARTLISRFHRSVKCMPNIISFREKASQVLKLPCEEVTSTDVSKAHTTAFELQSEIIIVDDWTCNQILTFFGVRHYENLGQLSAAKKLNSTQSTVITHNLT